MNTHTHTNAATSATATRRRLSRPEAADYLGVSTSWLEKRAIFGGGPKIIRIGARCVYDTADLDAYMAERTAA